MIKVETKKEIVVALTLSEENARWLMATMQNPLHGKDLDEESAQDSQKRHGLFMALRKGLNG